MDESGGFIDWVTPDDRLSVSEVARELGSSRSAVRKAIVRGTMAATLVVVALPGHEQSEYRVDRSEVERYRADHRTPRKPKRRRRRSASKS